MRGARHALDRNDVRQAGVCINVAPDHIEEVDQAAVFQTSGDFEAFRLADSALEPLVADETHADDEFVANPPAHGAQHFEGEAETVVERTAIGGSSVLVSGDQNWSIKCP
jgi:hypothetical protein